MISSTLLRTDSSHPEFITLVRELDAYLKIVDGDLHGFYDQYNHIENIPFVVVAYRDGKTAACGAFKAFDDKSVEIKRMFTSPEFRRSGLASSVLNQLEIWAKELGYEKCVLETGLMQKEAVQLYRKSGYVQIPNYGQYAGMENSLCFSKNIG
ncbi:MAG: GNAT family N-acetyltransferase [Bacteroidetes bacterium]|nr:GNAT family N-acetyltransferase [Bacteroidota bacterium]